jgi:hypothetical protein
VERLGIHVIDCSDFSINSISVYLLYVGKGRGKASENMVGEEAEGRIRWDTSYNVRSSFLDRASRSLCASI